MKIQILLERVIAVFLFVVILPGALGQGTGFTYQGHLSDGGTNANGKYDFTFSLFNSLNGGARVAGPITNTGVVVTNAYFMTVLDFGGGVFSGNTLWLDISVCTNGAGTFTELVPRQALTPVPQAIYAANANALTGTLPASQISGTPNAAVAFTGNLTGDVTGTQGATHLANVGTPGTYVEVTTDGKGRVIAGSGVADIGHGGTGQNTAALAAGAVGVAQTPGAPERDINYVNGNYGGQLGVSYNTFAGGLYWWDPFSSTWSGNFIFNGINQWGTFSNMSTLSTGHTIFANGNRVFWGTNGPALGSEKTLVLEQSDPRQATYINFGAPQGMGADGVPIMGTPHDFQVGMGGYLYGTNTLGGLGLAYDSIWAINPPVNMIFTTTVDAYPYGARSFLSYDNENAVWHFDADVEGNGTYKNTGHQDAMTLDTRSRNMTVGGDLYVGNAVTASELLSSGPIGSGEGNLSVPMTIDVTSSPFSWTNSVAFGNVTVFIDGGAVSSVAINGGKVFSSTGHEISLQTNEFVTIIFTAPPTMAWKSF